LKHNPTAPTSVYPILPWVSFSRRREARPFDTWKEAQLSLLLSYFCAFPQNAKTCLLRFSRHVCYRNYYSDIIFV